MQQRDARSTQLGIPGTKEKEGSHTTTRGEIATNQKKWTQSSTALCTEAKTHAKHLSFHHFERQSLVGLLAS